MGIFRERNAFEPFPRILVAPHTFYLNAIFPMLISSFSFASAQLHKAKLVFSGQPGLGPNMGAGQRGQAPPPYGAGPGNNPNQRGGYGQMGGPNPNGPGGSQSQPMSGSMAPPMQRNPSFGKQTFHSI